MNIALHRSLCLGKLAAGEETSCLAVLVVSLSDSCPHAGTHPLIAAAPALLAHGVPIKVHLDFAPELLGRGSTELQHRAIPAAPGLCPAGWPSEWGHGEGPGHSSSSSFQGHVLLTVQRRLINILCHYFSYTSIRSRGDAQCACSGHTLPAGTGAALLLCNLVFAEGLLWLGFLFSSHLGAALPEVTGKSFPKSLLSRGLQRAKPGLLQCNEVAAPQRLKPLSPCDFVCFVSMMLCK